MNFLLDTDTVAELRKGARADAGLVSWAQEVRGTFFISSITLLELEMGVRRAERQDAAQGVVLRSWFEDQVKAAFRGRILAIDAEVVLAAASMQISEAQGQRDALLAALAVAQHMPIVTRHLGGFKRAKGLTVVNPFG